MTYKGLARLSGQETGRAEGLLDGAFWWASQEDLPA